jgi:hypothetical protein
MLKRVAVLMVCLAAIVAIGSSGAFSAVSTDRGITASTADDPNAYVGIAEEECTITNQFPSGTTLDVTLSQNGEVVTEETIESGDTFDVETTGEVNITAVGSDGAVKTEMTRTFDCFDGEFLTGSVSAPGQGVEQQQTQLKLELTAQHRLDVTGISIESDEYDPRTRGSSTIGFTPGSSAPLPESFDGTEVSLNEASSYETGEEFTIQVQFVDGQLNVEETFVEPEDADIVVTVHFDGGSQSLGIATEIESTVDDSENGSEGVSTNTNETADGPVIHEFPEDDEEEPVGAEDGTGDDDDGSVDEAAETPTAEDDSD